MLLTCAPQSGASGLPTPQRGHEPNPLTRVWESRLRIDPQAIWHQCSPHERLGSGHSPGAPLITAPGSIWLARAPQSGAGGMPMQRVGTRERGLGKVSGYHPIMCRQM